MGIVVGLTGAELWAVADASPARQAPPPAFTPGETVEWLRARGVTNQERLLSLARPEYVPAAENAIRAELGGLPEPTVYSVLVAQKWHDTLTPNVALQFGLNTADGYDGGVLPLLRWLHVSKLVVDSPRPDGVLLTRLEAIPSDRLLDLLGVRYLIANDGTSGRPEMQMVDFGDLRLFARRDPVPRSLVVFGATSVSDESAALNRMSQLDFDSNREVVLETPQSLVFGPQSSPGPLAINPAVADSEAWRAHITLPQPGYLLQREAWYPGWRARVDGAEVPLLRADVLFRAVALTSGEHDVEIFFDSGSFKRGALTSAGALIVIILVLGWSVLPRMGVRVHQG
jgi:hypothetical protein